MKFFVDLDYTIFDTARLKADMAEALFKSSGLDPSVFRATYLRVARRLPDRHDYQMKLHAALLQNEYGLNPKKTLKILRSVLRQSKKYLLPGAIEFITALKTLGKIALLTHGAAEIQRRKINSAGLNKIFDEILIIPRPKMHFIKKFMEPKETNVLIDDSVSEALGVKKKSHKIKIVLCGREEKRAEQLSSGLPVFFSYDEILKYVSGLKII